MYFNILHNWQEAEQDLILNTFQHREHLEHMRVGTEEKMSSSFSEATTSLWYRWRDPGDGPSCEFHVVQQGEVQGPAPKLGKSQAQIQAGWRMD